MTDTGSRLGCCPQCGREISHAYLLIEYETDDGGKGIWAECPECADVVDPTSEECP
jgi:hypothetical protein